MQITLFVVCRILTVLIAISSKGWLHRVGPVVLNYNAMMIQHDGATLTWLKH